MKHAILVTYGEPQSSSFIEQLVYSWRILLGLTRSVADIPAPLVPIIALSRARGRNRQWREQSYRSPLEPITVAQAAQLRSALAKQTTTPWAVHVAYEFRAPLLPDVVTSLPSDDAVFVVPMYAADSAFTHALTRQSITGITRRGPVVVLPPIDGEALAELSAAHVMEQLAGCPPDTRSSALVLAAHGTLLNPARPIDTGLAATEALRIAIENRLSKCFGMVAHGWLNHTRGGKWTEPPIEETLAKVKDAGFRDVVYYPYGFLADNAESQLEGRVAAAAQPELRVRFVDCLNGSTKLSTALASQLSALIADS